jgi:chromosome segregation ATPase
VSRALKVVESPLEGAREELRVAILEVEQTEAAAAKSQAAVDRASDHLREKESAHVRATSALEEARAPRKSLAEKLANARGEEEHWAVVEEHRAEAGRPAVTAEDLKRLRAAVEAADDDVVAARSALDLAHDQARPTTSALNRAKDRRQRAVYEVARPQVGRLMREAQDLVERLGAKRAELSYVSNSLVNPMEGDRREAFFFLNRPAYPEESGLKSKNDPARRDAALASWAQFAERITQDASAQFPSS